VFVDKYLEKNEEGVVVERLSLEVKENKVLACLESGQKDRFSITAECGLNQNTVYLTLKVLEARGAIISTKIGRKTLWTKKPAVVESAF
jgi:predicted transcriptional regulator